MLWLVKRRRRAEPVTPAERRRGGHVTAFRRLGHALAGHQGLGLFGPLFLFAETRQRRTGQRVERAPASSATVTRQTTCANPPLKPPPAAVWTTHTLNPLLRRRDHQGQSRRRRRRHRGRFLG